MKGTRFERLMLLDRWLEGTFYDELPLSYEQDETNGKYNPMSDRQPAVQHNFPAEIAGLCARKVFGGRHIPRLKHQDKKFLLKVQALVEELKAPLKMLEAIKRGSVGSVAILFKFLETPVSDIDNAEMTVKGVIEVKQAQYCTPRFNKFQELTTLTEHYLVQGYEMLARQMSVTIKGDEVEPGLKYWFIKHTDTQEECIYYPIEEHDWNPITGHIDPKIDVRVPYPFSDDVANPVLHNLGFVPAVWIENLTGGKFPDGLSTFEPALDNFIEIDYIESQNGRGIKYNAAPQLMLKGDLRAEAEGDPTGPIARNARNVIRMAADEKGMDGMSASTGHDAKLLETNGASAAASQAFASGLKHTSFEQICFARKDLESIKGTMSGKVVELIDEDFLDLIQELKLQYGTYGYLLLVKKLCKAARLAGYELMLDASDKIVDGLTLDFPPLYLPDAQEINFLITAFVQATATQEEGPPTAEGKKTMVAKIPLLNPVLAANYLAKQMDLIEESDDKPIISDTQVATDGMPSPGPDSEYSTAGDDVSPELSQAEQLIVHGLSGGNIS